MIHSKGPWAVTKDNVVLDAQGFQIADASTGYVPTNESRANAKIFAASLDMAEALKLLMDGNELNENGLTFRTARTPNPEAIRKAIAALAKAGLS